MSVDKTLRMSKQRKPGTPWQRHGNKFTSEEAAKEKTRLQKKGWWNVTIHN